MIEINNVSSLVDSVNGHTGTVVLTAEDIEAAEAVHTHVTADITDLEAFGVRSFNTRTGVVSPTAGDYTLEMVGGNPITNTEIDELWNIN